MVRLVATDMDGTLFPEGSGAISQAYIDVIRRLREKGILFAAASGRHYSSILAIFRPVADDILYIAGNGSYVTGAGIRDAYRIIPEETALSVIDDIRKLCYHGRVNVDHPDVVLTEGHEQSYIDWIGKGYQNRLLVTDDIREAAKGAPIIKVAMYCEKDAQLLVPSLQEKYGEQCHVMSSGANWIDIVAKGTDKGAALREIQRQLGISPEETIAFGDNGNDIGMIRAAGRGYAVASAREEVKEAADEVIGTIEEDAVLSVLRKLL